MEKQNTITQWSKKKNKRTIMRGSCYDLSSSSWLDQLKCLNRCCLNSTRVHSSLKVTINIKGIVIKLALIFFHKERKGSRGEAAGHVYIFLKTNCRFKESNILWIKLWQSYGLCTKSCCLIISFNKTNDMHFGLSYFSLIMSLRTHTHKIL